MKSSRRLATRLISSIATPLTLSAVLLAPAARAQSSGAAAAQGLFDQAKALMAAGNATDACPKFEESERLDPGTGTLLNLASCYEQTGRFASAWSTYLEAAAAAKTGGDAERENKARELAAALAPRVSKLVVNVAPEARVAGLEVTRDGQPVGAPQWGLALPADRGQHTIAAKAPGFKDWQGTTAIDGDGTVATAMVPKLEEAPVAPASVAPKQGGLGPQKIAAIVSGGVGIVGLGIGSIFGIISMSDHSDAGKYCSGATCTDPRGVTAGNNAHSTGNVATVGMIIGAVGVVGAAVLWFTAPATHGSTEIGLGLGSVDVKGAF